MDVDPVPRIIFVIIVDHRMMNIKGYLQDNRAGPPCNGSLVGAQQRIYGCVRPVDDQGLFCVMFHALNPFVRGIPVEFLYAAAIVPVSGTGAGENHHCGRFEKSVRKG